MAIEFLENSEKRPYRGRSQSNQSLHQLIANIVWIPPHQIGKERQRFRRSQVPEDTYQFQLEIDRVLCMVFLSEADQVRYRRVRMIQDRVQEAVIYRDVAVRRGFEQCISPNAFVRPGFQEKFCAEQVLLFFPHHANRDFGWNFAVQPQRNLILAQRTDRFFERYLTPIDRIPLLFERFHDVFRSH